MHSLIKQVVVIVVFVVMALGSATPTYEFPTDQTNYSPIPIRFGTLVNKDLKIVAEDGSFTLIGGERFETPFAIDGWYAQSELSPYYAKNTDTYNKAYLQRFPNLLGVYPFTSPDKMLEHYNDALKTGGKKVLIYQEGYDAPLYGVLVLNDAISSAFGPASRSYMVNIPKAKLRAARDGVTAVTWENMKWKSTWSNGVVAEDHVWYSWALWISSYPF